MAQPVLRGTPEQWQRVADAVRRRRHYLNMTQAELAAAAGLSTAVIQVIEGAKQPNGTIAVRTATSLSYALKWDGDGIRAVLEGDRLVEHSKDSDAVTTELRDRMVDILVGVSKLSPAVQRPMLEAFQRLLDRHRSHEVEDLVADLDRHLDEAQRVATKAIERTS